MLSIKTIEFTGKEGRIDEVMPEPFTNWDAANKQLSQWSIYAPDDGSYHKTFFKIVFTDNTEYTGRFDLTRKGGTLQNHIREHLAFILNPHRPDYSQDQLDDLRNMYKEYVPEAARLMKNVDWN